MKYENIINYEKLNKINTKLSFLNIKSNFILRKIFDNLEKNKSLEIMKYNKQLQKRFNLTINDYKEYFEYYYSPIEIELKLVDNIYDEFINIPEEDSEYYHIYFDDSKEEIKRNYTNEEDKVKIIKIIINYQVKSFKGLFADRSFITSIVFKKFTRINIIDMSYMFYKCQLLKELNLSNFNTTNVINMSYMFSGCELLKELNLSNFNTNNVTDMSYMLSGCSSLKKLDISNFKINNVISMIEMFNHCSSLKEIKFWNDNINNITDTKGMFWDCSKKLLKRIKNQNKNMENIIDNYYFKFYYL